MGGIGSGVLLLSRVTIVNIIVLYISKWLEEFYILSPQRNIYEYAKYLDLTICIKTPLCTLFICVIIVSIGKKRLSDMRLPKKLCHLKIKNH